MSFGPFAGALYRIAGTPGLKLVPANAPVEVIATHPFGLRVSDRAHRSRGELRHGYFSIGDNTPRARIPLAILLVLAHAAAACDSNQPKNSSYRED